MNSPGPYDDEVVEDSEREDSEVVPRPRDSHASSIQTAEFSNAPQVDSRGTAGTEASNLSAFTDNAFNKPPLPSISTFTTLIDNDAPPTSAKVQAPMDSYKSRPKPRPIYRQKDTLDAINTSSNEPPSTHGASASTGSSSAFSEIPLDPYSSISIADRAKMRSRSRKPVAVDYVARSASSSKSQERDNGLPVNSLGVIELSSDEDDELALRPKPKAKPKPKPKPKPAPTEATASSSLASNARPKPRPIAKVSKRIGSPPHLDPTSQGTIPVPTSPILQSLHHLPHQVSSQLPPSDPPTSTVPDYDHPPIVTLLNTDLDPPTSSFNSIPSPPQSEKGKAAQLRELDELDSEGDKHGNITMVIDSRITPPLPFPAPPPTFFAGSSSSPISAGPRVLPAEMVEVVDLTVLAPTAEPSTSAGGHPKKTPKPRKPRKKKGGEDDINGEPVKPKPKAKPRAKKGPTGKQMEVVINVPAPNAPTTPEAKGKGKEALKSRDFVGTDNEDASVGPNAHARSISPAKPNSLTSLSSIPDSETETLIMRSGRKRKVAVDDNDNERDPLMSVQSPTKRVKGKARDEDEDDFVMATKESGVRGKGKGKMVVWSDDEEDAIATVVPLVEKSTGVKDKSKGKKVAKKAPAKKGRKAVPDAIDEPMDEDDGELGKHTNPRDEGGGMPKENEPPITDPVADTPAQGKPGTSPKVTPSISSRYSIAPKTKPTPMAELIRRVNSLPGSPFASPLPRASSSSLKNSTPGTAYSPYLKSSRSILARIAPLHPNRRTPPPPLPPPPPPKKTKKEKEREEKWEEEMIESAGGIIEWSCMTDAERKELRKIKWEREMGGWED